MTIDRSTIMQAMRKPLNAARRQRAQRKRRYSHGRCVRMIRKEHPVAALLRTNNPAGLVVESCRTEHRTGGSTHRRSARETTDLRETAHGYFQENIARTNKERSYVKRGTLSSFSPF